MKGEVDYTNYDKSLWEFERLTHRIVCPFCGYKTDLFKSRVYNFCECCGKSMRGTWHYEDEVN